MLWFFQFLYCNFSFYTEFAKKSKLATVHEVLKKVLKTENLELVTICNHLKLPIEFI